MTWLEAHAAALLALAVTAAGFRRYSVAAGASALFLADAGAVLARPWPYSALWASLGAPVSLGIVGELCGVFPRFWGIVGGVGLGLIAWGVIVALGGPFGPAGFAALSLSLYTTAFIVGAAWWLWRIRAVPLAAWQGSVESAAILSTMLGNITAWVIYALGGKLVGSVLVDIIGCVALIGAMVREAWDD